MIWVLDHLDDIESDFSVLHRIEDLEALDGPRFFRLASRLPAYQGVIRARLEAEQEAGQPVARSATYEPGASRRALAGPIPAGGRQHGGKGVSSLAAAAPWLIERKRGDGDGGVQDR